MKNLVNSLNDKIISKLCRSQNLFIRNPLATLAPTSFLDTFYNKNIGHNWNHKKSCITLSFDCDFKEDIQAIPFLLDILSSYSFKTCFACIGKNIEKYPKIHNSIIERGHEILNHTYTHPDNEEWNPNQRFNELTQKEQKFEIKKCDEICRSILEYSPAGFRIPHFGRLYTEAIYSILIELNYKYSSSTISVKTPHAGLPFLYKGIVEFPLSSCPRHPLIVFDTWHSLKRGDGLHKEENQFFNLFKDLIKIGIKNNSYINLYFDPQDLINIREFKDMMDFLDDMRKDILVAKYEDIIKGWDVEYLQK